MEVKIIQNSNQWNEAASRFHASFPQSWQWGEILRAEGKDVEFLAIENNGEVVMQTQVSFSNLPFGWKYAFCPKGPVGNLSKENLVCLADYLKQKNVIFFRCEPDKKIEGENIIKTIDVNPRATLILDLQKTEEEILEKMHTKTRYNIRLAQKKNLEIKNEKNLEVFLELMKKTGSRDKFRLHETKHYQTILDSEFSKQITIYSEGKSIATAVFVAFGDTFTYLFGASDHDYRSLMAPYLLQWEGIKIGKQIGYKFYDFFGVAPRINKEGEYEFDHNHQYAGVSRFKYGFGGIYYESSGTFDLVINNFKYNLYSLLRRLRRLF